MEKKEKMKLKTYLILFVGVFALSTSAIFVRIADAPSSVIAFYRLGSSRCIFCGRVRPEGYLRRYLFRIELFCKRCDSMRVYPASG